jgi:succinate-semialdehyde dehydrogenase/glutarate-semialdehyde dehydrogenase
MAAFQTVNPATGQAIAEYAHWNDPKIESSLIKAERAFSAWRRKTIEERARVLAKLTSVVQEQLTALARNATEEMGKPISQALAEVKKSLTAVDFYCNEGVNLLADLARPTEHRNAFVTYQPLGPVFCIMPWNFPYWQVFRCSIPAMVAGNTVLLKHSDNTTGCALLIEKLMQEAGIPDGVFQTVLADHSQAAKMIASDHVRAVSLTGSERAGRSVAAVAGAALKKCVLELGGSDPYVILADADVTVAARICMQSRLTNSGQSCIAAKRFIVHQAVYEDFRAACVEEAQKAVIGDPKRPETTVGPIARESILAETRQQVRKSLESGAKMVFEGSEPGQGYFHRVTILEDVRPGQPVFDEEVFAPVASLIRCANDEEALRLANQHRYGLGGAVFTRDLAKGETFARSGLEVGFAAVNAMVASDTRLPFGGVKASGFGRELAREGMLEFVNTKTVVVNG